ncbi:major facilitator family transporter [Chytriomyces sp. MP71]|nr:major facilitator family transporter [Chytriomyces sp. MP71]
MNTVSIVAATCCGTLIEWYDFYVYLFLQSTIATQFYAGTPNGATITWLATYAIGFLVRPIGAFIFGSLGDVFGRKTIFLATLLLMGLATTLCGCLPTISMVGPSAGAGIIVLRIIQGLALGGEYAGAIAYICEHAPKEQHGRYTCVLQVMAPLGLSLALAACLIFRGALGDAHFTSYGWRIPFLLSSLLIGVSLWARMKLLESPLYANAKENGQTSPNIGHYFKSLTSRHNLTQILIAIFAACMGGGVLAQVSQAYPLTFILATKVPLLDAYKICLIPFLLACPFFALFAYLSDSLGRKRLIVTGTALGAILCYPCYLGIYNYSPVYPDRYSPAMMGFCIWILVICAAIAYGPLAAFLAELFPTRFRFIGTAAAYHLGFGCLGGIQPVVTAQISASTGSVFGGLFYPIAVAGTCAIMGAVLLPETAGRDLAVEMGGEVLKPLQGSAEDVSQPGEESFVASS